MARSLSDYLDITLDQAVVQWREVLSRQPGPGRQGTFLPVEVLLCFSLFLVVDPHRFGGSNIHRAPAVVHNLAALTCRTAGSIISKMLNLDGSRANAGAFEWRIFMALSGASDQHAALYTTVLAAARHCAIGSDQLPDFLTCLGASTVPLLGQDEIDPKGLSGLLDREVPLVEASLRAGEPQTSRLVEYRARVGQHRFAAEVLRNCDYRCAFCGFEAAGLSHHRLLVASHIKPWARSSTRERLDVRNGIAACPIHDAAFDTGLLTVRGGLQVERAPRLEREIARAPSVARFFDRSVLQETLIMPVGALLPRPAYLDYHNSSIFQRAP